MRIALGIEAVGGAHLLALGAAQADTDGAGVAVVESFVGRTVAVLVGARTAQLYARRACLCVAFGAGSVRRAYFLSVGLTGADADGAGIADVESFVDRTVAVLVGTRAAPLHSRRARLRIALGTGAVGGADTLADCRAFADADRARIADVEAFVGQAIAVVVDPVTAGFELGTALHRIALGAGAVGRADLDAVRCTGANAGCARVADAEAFVRRAVAVLVDARAAKLDASHTGHACIDDLTVLAD